MELTSLIRAAAVVACGFALMSCAQPKASRGALVAGGAIRVDGSDVGTRFSLGSIECNLQPPVAANAGGWRPVGARSYAASGSRVYLPFGTYDLEFKPVNGLQQPRSPRVTLSPDAPAKEIARRYR